MFYIMLENGSQIVESYEDRPTQQELDAMAQQFEGDLYVIEGEHYGMTAIYVPNLYTVEENTNYPKGQGNLFLNKAGKCVGGAQKELAGQDKGKWVVDVNCVYNPEDDTDCMIIGWCATQDEARTMLLDYAVSMGL